MKNKVTIEDVNAAITNVTYTLLPNGRTTVCQVTVRGCFTVEGTSACVDIANYNEEIGQALAYKEAENKVWQLLGYELALQLKENDKSYEVRLQYEHDELLEKVQKLRAYADQGYPQANEAQKDLLAQQLNHMTSYHNILKERLNALSITG